MNFRYQAHFHSHDSTKIPKEKNNDKRSTIKLTRSIYTLADEQQNRREKVNEKMKERRVMLFKFTQACSFGGEAKILQNKRKNKRKKERKKNDPGIICPWKSRRSGVPLHTWSGVSDTLFLFSWLTCALLTYGCSSSVSGLLVGYYYRIVTCNNAKPTHQTFT